MTTRRVEWVGAGGHRLAGDRPVADGHPVLLLHGGGQTRQAWSHVAGLMAGRGLSPIAVDQRGHGDSEWIAGGGYSFFDFGADAGALADAIAVQAGAKPIAVGASLGGIASLLAQGEADRFAALILVDVTPSLNEDGVARVHRFMTDRLADGFASLEDAAEAVAAYLPNRRPSGSSKGLAKNLRRSADGRFRWHWDPAFIDGPNSVAMRRDAARTAMIAAAQALTIPTLLVRGGRSDMVTSAEIDEFRALVPAAEFVDIAGAGHMVAGDRNDVFGDAILDFLARHGFATPAG